MFRVTVSRLHWILVLGLALLFLTASPVLAADALPKSSMASMAVTVSMPIPTSACPRLHTINPNEKKLVQITDWYGLDLAPLTTGDMLCLAAPAPKLAVRATPVYGCSKLHTVNPNEKQLVQITDWYGLDLAAVAALNGMDPAAPLTTGSMLCLSATAIAPAAQAPAQAPVTTDEMPSATPAVMAMAKEAVPVSTSPTMSPLGDRQLSQKAANYYVDRLSHTPLVTGRISDPVTMMQASRIRWCDTQFSNSERETCWYRLQNNLDPGFFSINWSSYFVFYDEGEQRPYRLQLVQDYTSLEILGIMIDGKLYPHYFPDRLRLDADTIVVDYSGPPAEDIEIFEISPSYDDDGGLISDYLYFSHVCIRPNQRGTLDGSGHPHSFLCNGIGDGGYYSYSS